MSASMWLFPLAAAIVAGAFAFQMGRQFAAKRRPHQLAWTLALTMFSLAALVTGEGVRAGWTPALFRTFYLFGAVINVPFLALGTVYLLAPRKWGHAFAVAVVAASAVGLVAVLGTPLHVAQLRAVKGIPDFARIIAGPAPLSRTLADYYSYTAFAIVVGGAVWSAGRLLSKGKGNDHLRRLASGNILIACGTTVVAAASIAIHFGKGPVVAALFSVGLLAGITLMFGGFLRTRSRPAPVAGRAPAAISPVQPATPAVDG
ncbi:MAG TPA: hypothetical protein VKY26_11695 [Actinomycetota bacterium]|nr:hypothetical protein [Actinomycetota bacterium]